MPIRKSKFSLSDLDKGFECIITNNNNNTINVAGGNETTPPVLLTCEECFRAFLTEDQITFYLSGGDISSLDEACERFFIPGSEIFEGTFIADLRDAGASLRNIVSLIE